MDKYKVVKPESAGESYYIAPEKGGRCFLMRNKQDAEDLVEIINTQRRYKSRDLLTLEDGK